MHDQCVNFSQAEFNISVWPCDLPSPDDKEIDDILKEAKVKTVSIYLLFWFLNGNAKEQQTDL